MYTPRKNSSADTVRSPSWPRIVNVASSATRSSGRWFVGSLTQTLPPIVPRLRTWTSAIVAATSARIGRATSTSDEPMSCAYVTIAPISSIPSDEKPIARSSSRSARSTSTSGAAARAFMTLTSVCPPASARAPSYVASSEIASSTVAGRAYSTSRRSMPRFSHTTP